MHRNLSARVEVVTPVTSRHARERLWEILSVALQDRRQAWEMDTQGQYTQRQPHDSTEGPARVGTHQCLMESAKRSCV